MVVACPFEEIKNANVAVKFVVNEKGNPPGKLADAELHFTSGPLAGLNARAVFVVDKTGTVRHVEYVKDITQEPDYDAALKAAKQAAGA